MSNQITATLKIVNTDDPDQYLVRPDFPLFLSSPPHLGYSIDLTGNGRAWFNVDEIPSYSMISGEQLILIHKVNGNEFAELQVILINQKDGWTAQP